METGCIKARVVTQSGPRTSTEHETQPLQPVHLLLLLSASCTVSSASWAYRSVDRMLLCPAAAWITSRGTPAFRIAVAVECLVPS